MRQMAYPLPLPIISHMEPGKTVRKCRRCNKNMTDDIVCTSCKSELINYFEASGDWQTAYEIEKAQLIASRYNSDNLDDNENY